MDLYILTLQKWLKQLLPNPHKVLHISLVFLLLSLPVVTVGYAACVCLLMARFSVDESEVGFREIVGIYAKPIFLKAVAMGLLDICLAVLTVLCAGLLIKSDTSTIARFFYCLYLIMELFLLLSSIYRYPILVCNPKLRLSDVFKRGALITFKYLFRCILFALVMLTAFILCALTGVGIILVFPGLVAFFVIIIYRQTLAYETEDDDGLKPYTSQKQRT